MFVYFINYGFSLCFRVVPKTPLWLETLLCNAVLSAFCVNAVPQYHSATLLSFLKRALNYHNVWESCLGCLVALLFVSQCQNNVTIWWLVVMVDVFPLKCTCSWGISEVKVTLSEWFAENMLPVLPFIALKLNTLNVRLTLFVWRGCLMLWRTH